MSVFRDQDPSWTVFEKNLSVLLGPPLALIVASLARACEYTRGHSAKIWS